MDLASNRSRLDVPARSAANLFAIGLQCAGRFLGAVPDNASKTMLAQERLDKGAKIPTPKPIAGESSGTGRLEIAILIANKKASAHINIILSGQVGDHTRLGLTSPTSPSIPLYDAIRMMRTVLEPIDLSP